MKIEITVIQQIPIAIVTDESIVIRELGDALDLIGNASYQGAYKIILKETQIVPEFFDLKTGLAGEILQKFSTYNLQLAIVGDFDKFDSKALKDFIYESNKAGRILFVSSMEEAREKLNN